MTWLGLVLEFGLRKAHCHARGPHFVVEGGGLQMGLGFWYGAAGGGGGCACDCHTDPKCDGVATVIDVVLIVDVAFRNGSPFPDPNGFCPYVTTDVNCNGVTNVVDAVLLVEVALRGGDASALFCDPCGASPLAQSGLPDPDYTN